MQVERKENMSFLSKLFHRNHHCDYKQVGSVYHASHVNNLSAGPTTAKIFRCSCGGEYRELTPAGLQQASWGDDIEHLLGKVSCKQGGISWYE